MTRSLTVRVYTAVSPILSPNRSTRTPQNAIWGQQSRIKRKTVDAFRAVIDTEDPVSCFQSASWPLTIDYVVARGKGRRPMDDSNIKACMKYVEDGIASSLGMNDRDFILGTVTQVRSENPAKPYIDITITEASHAAGNPGE